MNRSWKMLLADTVAMILFSTAMCMMIEIFAAGMTVMQSLVARIAAVPTNLLTGRLYGCYRDMLFRRFDLKVDSLPLYVLVLLLAHASVNQIIISTTMMTLIFAVAGRPYGIFMDYCRKFILAFFQG